MIECITSESVVENERNIENLINLTKDRRKKNTPPPNSLLKDVARVNAIGFII